MIFINIDWHMSVCLYRICMEQDLMLLRDLTDLLDWLDASDLVICKHNGNQDCILTDCLLQLVKLQDTILVHADICDLVAKLLKILACMQDCVMLDG